MPLPARARPAVVLGLHWAGLALVRPLGRAGIRVIGVSQSAADYGLSSRYVACRHLIEAADASERERRVLAVLAEVAREARPVLFPDSDDNVELVLRHWDFVQDLADVPLGPDPETVQRLRRKDELSRTAAQAGVPIPTTILASSEPALRAGGLRPPLLIKPVEGKTFETKFGEKAFLARDLDGAVAAWHKARAGGFETIIQELVPDAEEAVFSLFTYVGRAGEPLASVVGRKVRQLPLHFGSSTVFEARHDPRPLELGLRLLRYVGYRGFAHVEFAYDRRDGDFKLLEVNTRVPVWASIAMAGEFNMARIAYDDLCGHGTPAAAPEERRWWVDLQRDLLQLVRRRDFRPRAFVTPYVQRSKARAVFAADDPRPTLAQLKFLARRVARELRQARPA